MNLRLKLLLTLIAVFMLYVTFDFAIQKFVVYPGFLRLEREEAKQDLLRCHQAIENDIEHLDFFAHDWAAWDDLHRYATDHNVQFENENFVESMFRDANLNLLIVVDSSLNVVHHDIKQSGSQDSIELSLFPSNCWPVEHPLLGHADSQEPLSQRVIRGILKTEHGPLAVVSRPILRSGNLGPINGTLVFGRFLNHGAIDVIANQTAVDFSIHELSDLELASDDNAYGSGTLDSPYFAFADDDTRRLKIQSVLFDLAGKPVLLTQAEVDRSISLQGRVAINYAISSLIIAAFFVLTILLLLLQRIVISPLTYLSDHASRIAATGDLTRRAQLQRNDELGNLAKCFDSMVQTLADTQSRMIALSREAGMSEVATGVLHNVGNVMTNVNVITSSVTNTLKTSKIASLRKSVALLRTHQQEMGEFLLSDARGQKLPEFICQVTDHLDQEHQDILAQLTEMSTSLQHVNQILDSQREFASGTGILERVDLQRVVRDAVGMLGASLQRHGVSVNVQSDGNTPLLVDRGKLIQILVNLLTNAKDAVKHLEASRRELQVHINSTSEHLVTIELSDRGYGIDSSNLQKIFSRGFTTKADGHGHGLHFCANAAKELKGTLTAHSDGPDQGATFALTLPCVAIESEVCN